MDSYLINCKKLEGMKNGTCIEINFGHYFVDITKSDKVFVVAMGYLGNIHFSFIGKVITTVRQVNSFIRKNFGR